MRDKANQDNQKGNKRNKAKPISGTEAAKIMRVKNNQAFVKLFVETGQIKPIKYPGKKKILLFRRGSIRTI